MSEGKRKITAWIIGLVVSSVFLGLGWLKSPDWRIFNIFTFGLFAGANAIEHISMAIRDRAKK